MAPGYGILDRGFGKENDRSVNRFQNQFIPPHLRIVKTNGEVAGMDLGGEKQLGMFGTKAPSPGVQSTSQNPTLERTYVPPHLRVGNLIDKGAGFDIGDGDKESGCGKIDSRVPAIELPAQHLALKRNYVLPNLRTESLIIRSDVGGEGSGVKGFSLEMGEQDGNVGRKPSIDSETDIFLRGVSQQNRQEYQVLPPLKEQPSISQSDLVIGDSIHSANSCLEGNITPHLGVLVDLTENHQPASIDDLSSDSLPSNTGLLLGLDFNLNCKRLPSLISTSKLANLERKQQKSSPSS